MLNRSEFNFQTIEPLIPFNYAAFRGKNEYSGHKMGEEKFFANMNTCWATVAVVLRKVSVQ